MATLTGMLVRWFAVFHKNQAAHRSGEGRCVNDQKWAGVSAGVCRLSIKRNP
jgi:hypothetical protein